MTDVTVIVAALVFVLAATSAALCFAVHTIAASNRSLVGHNERLMRAVIAKNIGEYNKLEKTAAAEQAIAKPDPRLAMQREFESMIAAQEGEPRRTSERLPMPVGLDGD